MKAEEAEQTSLRGMGRGSAPKAGTASPSASAASMSARRERASKQDERPTVRHVEERVELKEEIDSALFVTGDHFQEESDAYDAKPVVGYPDQEGEGSAAGDDEGLEAGFFSPTIGHEDQLNDEDANQTKIPQHFAMNQKSDSSAGQDNDDPIFRAETQWTLTHEPQNSARPLRQQDPRAQQESIGDKGENISSRSQGHCQEASGESMSMRTLSSDLDFDARKATEMHPRYVKHKANPVSTVQEEVPPSTPDWPECEANLAAIVQEEDPQCSAERFTPPPGLDDLMRERNSRGAAVCAPMHAHPTGRLSAQAQRLPQRASAKSVTGERISRSGALASGNIPFRSDELGTSRKEDSPQDHASPSWLSYSTADPDVRLRTRREASQDINRDRKRSKTPVRDYTAFYLEERLRRLEDEEVNMKRACEIFEERVNYHATEEVREEKSRLNEIAREHSIRAQKEMLRQHQDAWQGLRQEESQKISEWQCVMRNELEEHQGRTRQRIRRELQEEREQDNRRTEQRIVEMRREEMRRLAVAEEMGARARDNNGELRLMWTEIQYEKQLFDTDKRRFSEQEEAFARRRTDKAEVWEIKAAALELEANTWRKQIMLNKWRTRVLRSRK